MEHPSPPSRERLQSLIHGFDHLSVAVVADMVADRFVSGTVKRISREAPVLIIRQDHEEIRPGGGANAVANVASLGGAPKPLGMVGRDSSGCALRLEFEQRGINTSGLISHPTFATPTKTRILGGGRHTIKQQIVRVDREDFFSPSPQDLDVLSQRARELGPYGAVIISDYGYGSAGPDMVQAIQKQIGTGPAILCDSRYRLDAFPHLDGATPNEDEAEKLLGRPLGNDRDTVARSVLTLRHQLGVRYLLVTRGSSGMCLVTSHGVAFISVHGGEEIVDVTGAGDTVIATFALAIGAGGSPLEAALLANYAGGIVVMKAGTATVSAEELSTAIHQNARPLEDLQWVNSSP